MKKYIHIAPGRKPFLVLALFAVLFYLFAVRQRNLSYPNRCGWERLTLGEDFHFQDFVLRVQGGHIDQDFSGEEVAVVDIEVQNRGMEPADAGELVFSLSLYQGFYSSIPKMSVVGAMKNSRKEGGIQQNYPNIDPGILSWKGEKAKAFH